MAILCNPPFAVGLIDRFVLKAIDAADRGSTVVLPLPAWEGPDWDREVKERGRMQDVIGPIRFERPDGGHWSGPENWTTG